MGERVMTFKAEIGRAEPVTVRWGRRRLLAQVGPSPCLIVGTDRIFESMTNNSDRATLTRSTRIVSRIVMDARKALFDFDEAITARRAQMGSTNVQEASKDLKMLRDPVDFGE